MQRQYKFIRMAVSSLTFTKKYSFNESILFNTLNKMTLGTLRLTLSDGEDICFGNGDGIIAKMHIKNNAFFKKCILYGDIGFGESYVDGDWETDNIANVISWFILNRDTNPAISGTKIKASFINLFKYFNRAYHNARENTVGGSKENISEHYDLGNDFYSLFLDKTMTYSSGIFRKEDTTLEEAQIEKYDRLCRLLKIKPTDHVLEIGSGWGGFSVHCAKNYGCRITTVTISEEQFKYAKTRFENEGLTGKVEILLMDYRKIKGRYDKIVSIEMLEAVGHKYLPVYFKKCNDLLSEQGSLALQVITCPDARYNDLRKSVDFIQKHIFPGSLLPSISMINKSVNNTTDFNLYDIKDIGLDYAKTLKKWHEVFNKHLEEVRLLGMDERFIRKWNYYLQYCEAAFRMRNISTMQIVYSRTNHTNI